MYAAVIAIHTLHSRMNVYRFCNFHTQKLDDEASLSSTKQHAIVQRSHTGASLWHVLCLSWSVVTNVRLNENNYITPYPTILVVCLFIKQHLYIQEIFLPTTQLHLMIHITISTKSYYYHWFNETSRICLKNEAYCLLGCGTTKPGRNWTVKLLWWAQSSVHEEWAVDKQWMDIKILITARQNAVIHLSSPTLYGQAQLRMNWSGDNQACSSCSWMWQFPAFLTLQCTLISL